MDVYKPILFNTEMTLAILEGRKKRTRRLIPLRYSNTHLEMFTNKYGARLVEMQNEEEGVTVIHRPDGTTTHRLLATFEKEPKYHRGDLLYVRETWNQLRLDAFGDKKISGWFYKASEEASYLEKNPGWKWRPSIHMPKEAARIFLRVCDVHPEKLQSITREDAILEGAHNMAVPIQEFARIWDGTIKKSDLPENGWDANPWVWVIKFEKIKKPEGWPNV